MVPRVVILWEDLNEYDLALFLKTLLEPAIRVDAGSSKLSGQPRSCNTLNLPSVNIDIALSRAQHDRDAPRLIL